MKVITLTPDEVKEKIETHFTKFKLKAELYTTLVAQSGNKIHKVRFEGIFNTHRILEIDIYFNGQQEPIITDFKGICPISELIDILTELKTVIDKL